MVPLHLLDLPAQTHLSQQYRPPHPYRLVGRMGKLDLEVDVIRAQGLHATTVDDLCAAAGVTKGAFFHHFATKEALAVAAVWWGR